MPRQNFAGFITVKPLFLTTLLQKCSQDIAEIFPGFFCCLDRRYIRALTDTCILIRTSKPQNEQIINQKSKTVSVPLMFES